MNLHTGSLPISIPGIFPMTGSVAGRGILQ
jgi:hypothetical protein